MIKETYYVTPKGELYDSKIEGQQLNSFEIKANGEEYMKLQQVIEQLRSQKYVQQHDFFSTNHFNEHEVDSHRDWTDEATYNLYYWIHKLGTPETKAQIEQMGVLNALNTSSKK